MENNKSEIKAPYIHILFKNGQKAELGNICLGEAIPLEQHAVNLLEHKKHNALFKSGLVVIDTSEIVMFLIIYPENNAS